MTLKISDIIDLLETFRDERRAGFAKISYPTSMKVIGVTGPNEKKVLQEIKIATKTLAVKDKLEFAKQLVRTGIFECQHIAFEFIGKDRKILNALSEKDIDELFLNLDNWASVDGYGVYIVGYAWRVGIISIDKIKSYLDSDDFWTRRIAIVATVSLNQKARGGEGDKEQTLEICKLVVDDHHDMINKALSWALRELAKIDKEPVYEFIETYKTSLHKRVLREVTNKLVKGTKN